MYQQVVRLDDGSVLRGIPYEEPEGPYPGLPYDQLLNMGLAEGGRVSIPAFRIVYYAQLPYHDPDEMREL